MYQVKVIDLGYNLIVGCIVGTNKSIYIHKYPPAMNTTKKPDITNIFDHVDQAVHVNQAIHVKHLNPMLKKETLINFWTSQELYQANGDWKGGEWGSNNLPTTSENFCSGVFIGDTLELSVIKCGIIPYLSRLSKPFEPEDQIIQSSEDLAWSSNISRKVSLSPNPNPGLNPSLNPSPSPSPNPSLNPSLNPSSDLTYSCYVCDSPMPQSAIDVLFVWENSLGEKYVKILRRGNSNPNLDMPNLLIPGAGEHREPGNGICIKSDALRAIHEEIGIDESVLSSSYLIPVGTFDKEKRDPRYWSYSVIQDSQMIKFGPERKSESVVYVLYIKTETAEKPKEIDCGDKIEIENKYWIKLNSPILSNRELWMIPEHSYYFEHASAAIELFNKSSDVYKEQHRFNI